MFFKTHNKSYHIKLVRKIYPEGKVERCLKLIIAILHWSSTESCNFLQLLLLMLNDSDIDSSESGVYKSDDSDSDKDDSERDDQTSDDTYVRQQQSYLK